MNKSTVTSDEAKRVAWFVADVIRMAVIRTRRVSYDGKETLQFIARHHDHWIIDNVDTGEGHWSDAPCGRGSTEEEAIRNLVVAALQDSFMYDLFDWDLLGPSGEDDK
jgi:hypothetical protein